MLLDRIHTIVTPLLLFALPCVGAKVSTDMAAEVERQATASVASGASGARVVRAQILLARARYSPGEIDGVYGEDLAIAIKGFQENHDLKPTGVIDSAMWELLNADTEPLLRTYTITAADVKGPFEPIPKDVAEQAKLKSMGFESPGEEFGEMFHMSPKLIADLNPGKKLDTVGEEITVASIPSVAAQRATRLEVSKSKRTVTAFGAGDKVLAQYPATIGGEHDPLPLGRWTIRSVSHDPWYNWDPSHFWNGDMEKPAQKLPPGPNNPVGVVWIGLSKPHIGIHGTPDPGHIRHGESNGCIRLTNWDANQLSHMVIRGTPVNLEE